MQCLRDYLESLSDARSGILPQKEKKKKKKSRSIESFLKLLIVNIGVSSDVREKTSLRSNVSVTLGGHL